MDKNIRQITDDRKIAEVHRGRKVVSELARKNKLEGGHGVTTQAMRKKGKLNLTETPVDIIQLIQSKLRRMPL